MWMGDQNSFCPEGVWCHFLAGPMFFLRGLFVLYVRFAVVFAQCEWTFTIFDTLEPSVTAPVVINLRSVHTYRLRARVRHSHRSRFYIMSMATVSLTSRMGLKPISDTIKMFTINTMLNFDIDFDRGGNGNKNRS